MGSSILIQQPGARYVVIIGDDDQFHVLVVGIFISLLFVFADLFRDKLPQEFRQGAALCFRRHGDILVLQWLLLLRCCVDMNLRF